MSALAYLDYFLRNSGTVEASEVIQHRKAANPALLQCVYNSGILQLRRSRETRRTVRDPTHQLAVRARAH